MVFALLVHANCDQLVDLLLRVSLVAPPAFVSTRIGLAEGVVGEAAGAPGVPVPDRGEGGSTPAGAPQSGLESLLLTWTYICPYRSGEFEKKISYVLLQSRDGSVLWVCLVIPCSVVDVG